MLLCCWLSEDARESRAGLLCWTFWSFENGIFDTAGANARTSTGIWDFCAGILQLENRSWNLEIGCIALGVLEKIEMHHARFGRIGVLEGKIETKNPKKSRKHTSEIPSIELPAIRP
jgi:hypothetical protein